MGNLPHTQLKLASKATNATKACRASELMSPISLLPLLLVVTAAVAAPLTGPAAERYGDAVDLETVAAALRDGLDDETASLTWGRPQEPWQTAGKRRSLQSILYKLGHIQKGGK